MLLSMPTEYYCPQFLKKQYCLYSKNKYFPEESPQINVYLKAIEECEEGINHGHYAKALNYEMELINEFLSIGSAFANCTGFIITDWINEFCKDLNVNVNIYNEDSQIYNCVKSNFTQALVLSIITDQNSNGYGVIYHENYTEFSPDHHNLNYNVETCPIKLTELQEFEVFTSKSLDFIVKEQITEHFSAKMNEMHYKIKLSTRKFCLFEERMSRIGKIYLGNIENCSFCSVNTSAIRLECKCFLCNECVNAYLLTTECPSCSTKFSDYSRSVFNTIKSTFT